MKLDRNINSDGRGKYALINLRNVPRGSKPQRTLENFHNLGILDWGNHGEPDEFFVLRLKDKYAQAALMAYAAAAATDDPEYAAEIREMAQRSGPGSRFCKAPD